MLRGKHEAGEHPQAHAHEPHLKPPQSSAESCHRAALYPAALCSSVAESSGTGSSSGAERKLNPCLKSSSWTPAFHPQLKA